MTNRKPPEILLSVEIINKEPSGESDIYKASQPWAHDWRAHLIFRVAGAPAFRAVGMKIDFGAGSPRVLIEGLARTVQPNSQVLGLDLVVSEDGAW